MPLNPSSCADPSNLCTNGSVCLVGGGTPNQGRVELCIGGDWGTICGDYNWDNVAARVVCNQLGYTNTTGRWGHCIGRRGHYQSVLLVGVVSTTTMYRDDY